MIGDSVITAVAAAYEIPRRQITSRDRSQWVAEARMVAAYLLRQRYESLSLVEIGRVLGGRHHTTISYAIGQVEKRAAGDRALRRRLEAARGNQLGADLERGDPAVDSFLQECGI